MRTHMVPTTPEQVLKRIMHDMSTHLRTIERNLHTHKRIAKVSYG